jgi:hypothetical protein
MNCPACGFVITHRSRRTIHRPHSAECQANQLHRLHQGLQQIREAATQEAGDCTPRCCSGYLLTFRSKIDAILAMKPIDKDARTRQ